MSKLNDQRVVVTAGSRGLGRAIVGTALAREVAGAYARRQGQPLEAYVAARTGERLEAAGYGRQVTTLLAEETSMKFMVLTYEANEDFAAREDDQRRGGYLAAWKTYGEALRRVGIYVTAWPPPRPPPPCGCATASDRCRTAPTPTPRSNSAATTSSRWPTWTRRWSGRPAAPPPPTAPSSCAPW
jgi:hypothetical protein